MRYLPAVILIVAMAEPAQGEAARVTGKMGYLSEWEVTARVTEKLSEGKKQYSGPLTVRHVGVCTTGRPAEMTGEIRYQTTGWVKPRMKATLLLEGVDCGFEGSLGQTYDGVMSCEQWRGVPVSLSIKPGGVTSSETAATAAPGESPGGSCRAPPR
jgi:hypothetical protein